jgi:hypothetical protein
MKSRSIGTALVLCLLAITAIGTVAAVGTTEPADRTAVTPEENLPEESLPEETLYDNAEAAYRCELADPNDELGKRGHGNGDDDDDDDSDDLCVCYTPRNRDPRTVCGRTGLICGLLAAGAEFGRCPAACGGSEGTPCEDGQFCKAAEGECGDDAEGQCTDAPANCPSELQPVCGCDGNTYSNACFADAAGVSVDFEGECPPPELCGGTAGATCEDDEYCQADEIGACGTNAAGTCRDIPEACSDRDEPVCGCNGITYDNDCEAAAAGVNVDSEGACDEDLSCGGSSTNTCDDGSFCKADEGDCTEDAAGTCTEQPEACPAVFAPVCGCDGVTYDNECLADAAGTSVDTQGACEPDPDAVACGGDEGDTCNEDRYCKTPVGQCAEDDESVEGFCALSPETCSAVYDPVCGCDGLTYPNACTAARLGINVEKEGRCRRN